MMAQEKPEYDFSRNDKFYSLTIPRYSSYEQVVMYEVHLKDLVNNKEFINFFRFKDLKEVHEDLMNLKLELPEFPKTHFWRKTNKNPELISERRVKLEYYFQIIVNDPFTRGYPEIKKLIKMMKNSSRRIHRFSSPPQKSNLSTYSGRSHSFSKTSATGLNMQALEKLKKSSPKKG